MPYPIRPKALLLAKILFGCLYAPLAAELFLRTLAPVPVLPRHVCPTSYGIRGNEPNSRYWHFSKDYRIQIRTNSKGIRADEEFDYQKSPGVKRIVVLGDSFGMGYEVNLRDSFLTRMDESLKQAGVNCQVINLSVSGYGNAEELIALREEGLKYSPDVVLLAWHCSDYDDNLRSALFALENGRLVRRNPSYLPGMKLKETLERTIIYPWIAEYSSLHAWLREYVAMRAQSMLAMLRSRSIRAHNATPKVVEAGNSVSPASRDLTVALLRELRGESERAGAKFMILDIPARRSRVRFPSLFPVDPNGNNFGFEVFSPIRLFEQHRGELLYWENSHYHFTPLASRLVGEGLADFILKQGWLGN